VNKQAKELGLTVSQNLFRIIGHFKKEIESTEPLYEDVVKTFGLPWECKDIRTIEKEWQKDAKKE